MQKRYNIASLVLSAAVLCHFAASARAGSAPTPAELVAVLQEVDERQQNAGDFRFTAYMEQRDSDTVTSVHDAQVFRRSADQCFMIVFTAPKSSQGQGYLRVEKNLWFYDPSVGKWERRTERERIAGTDSRRADFDESHLASDYDPNYEGDEKLGAYDTMILKLKAKPGRDLAYPVAKIWIDKATRNVLKRQESGVSERLLRTTYYPRWKKVYSQSKNGDVWFPEETRVYDEVKKGSSTLMLVKNVDASPFPGNIFTKAWLESKSR
jgi:outer membrane lipoprotein-sorting protein